MAFTPGSTLIVDGEKLTLKETLTLLDGALRHNVQLLIADSGQRTGTGSALTVMKEAGVSTLAWQGGEKTQVSVISEPDRRQRYDRPPLTLPEASAQVNTAWRRSPVRASRRCSQA